MRLLKFLVFALIYCLGALNTLVFSQGAGLELIRVELWTPKEGALQWIRIKKDGLGTSPVSVEEHKTKVWMRTETGNITKLPAAYMSGSTPRISACFRKKGRAGVCTSNGNANQSIKYYVRATMQDIAGMTLPPQQLQLSGSPDTYEYVTAEANKSFNMNEIRYFPAFKIIWEWSLTGEYGSWKLIEISENVLYVTLDMPIKENDAKGYRHFETLLYIGCKYANGDTNHNALVNAVKQHFSTRSVQRSDGEPMKYYGQWTNGNLASKTDELLASLDGMCMAWTRLFLDVLKMQGLWEDENYIVVKARNSDGFFVKTWETDITIGTSDNPLYPFKNVKGVPFYTGNQYNWQYAEVSLSQALASQNNSNPQSDFGQHIFAK